MNSTSSESLQSIPPMFGREGDLLEMERVFADGDGWVVVVGPGGVGKTRLAMRFAERQAASDQRPVVFCDLSVAENVSVLCSRVAETLLLSIPVGKRDPVVAIGRAVAQLGSTLIVLDGVDKGVTAFPGLLHVWRRFAPRARWVVTSRTWVGAESKSVYQLAALPLPNVSQQVADSAVGQLWYDRVKRVRPDYSLDDAEAHQVVKLLGYLGGNPLAIELAAARMNMFETHHLVERFAGQTDVCLQRRKCDDAGVWWSWSLLLPWEKSTLAQCSVFRGGFSREAASHIVDLSAFDCAPPVDVVMQSLQEQCLLCVREETERLFVSLSIREFADRKLVSLDPEGNLLRRHAAYYAQVFLASRSTYGTEEELKKLTLERDNLYAVVERGIDGIVGVEDTIGAVTMLHLLCRSKGPIVPIYAATERLAQRIQLSDVEPALFAGFQLAHAWGQVSVGRLKAARTTLAETLRLARKLDVPTILGHVLLDLAQILLREGQANVAMMHLTEARERLRNQGESSMELLAQCLSGWTWIRLANTTGLRQAQQYLSRAATAFHNVIYDGVAGDRGLSRGGALVGFAQVAIERGDHTSARSYCAYALPLLAQANDQPMLARVSAMRGLIEHDQGNAAPARTHYREAIGVARRIAGHEDAREYAGYLILLEMMSGQYPGVQDAVRAQSAAQAIFDPHRAAIHFAFAAALYGRLGKEREAIDALSAGQQSASDEDKVAHCLLDIARAFVHLCAADRCDLNSDPVAATLHQDNAKKYAASARKLALVSIEVRLSLRWLEGVLNDLTPTQVIHSQSDALSRLLCVDPDWDWFQLVPEDRVDMATRPLLKRVFRRLMLARELAPARGVSVRDLAAAVWPNVSSLPFAAMPRIYVALAVLRRLGLREVLCRSEEGYFLDPLCPVSRDAQVQAFAPQEVINLRG